MISATNRDVKELIKNNKFRLDLFHRLNTFHIDIPPLRERPEDIEPLLNHFVEEFSRIMNKPVPAINKNVIPFLKKYPFPGNVRELRNMVERAIILYKGNTIEISDFPIENTMNYLSNETDSFNLNDLEKKTIYQALEKSNYNQTFAADMLGITRDALIRKMKKYNINIQKDVVIDHQNE